MSLENTAGNLLSCSIMKDREKLRQIVIPLRAIFHNGFDKIEVPSILTGFAQLVSHSILNLKYSNIKEMAQHLEGLNLQQLPIDIST